MTKLSVNINKIATLRNARGNDVPNVLLAAKNIQHFGADGITLHPRPDERHIRYQDVIEIKPLIKTELNIEGNPKENKFIDLVLKVKPQQVTLVPDNENQLTSDHGWDTIKHLDFLKEIIQVFKNENIRTSIFLNPNPELVSSAKESGTDRIELYTAYYAHHFKADRDMAIAQYKITAAKALDYELQINAGHDLDLHNLKFFKQEIPFLSEVSIGHALISDALYLGLENTVQMYKSCLK